MDQSTQRALVSNAAPGCTVELWSGDSSALVPVATSSAAFAGLVRVRLPRTFPPGQVVRALQKLNTITSLLGAPVVVANNYVTQHYDNARTGLNPYEDILTKSNVPTLRLLITRTLPKIGGYPQYTDNEIHAQPLYVQDVAIPGKGKHNMVIVATESNTLHAFDADSDQGVNSDGLWPSPYSLIGPGEKPVTSFGSCSLQRGITSTPVIDRTTDTLYVVGIADAGGPKWRIHAVDISTGQDKKNAQGQPIRAKEISAPGFLPLYQLNRAGLVLDDGILYVPFGSHCHDDRPATSNDFYHGWLMAYDVDIPGSSSFLTQVGVFNTTEQLPQACGGDAIDDAKYGGGIWQAGIAPAADGAGNVYFSSGNGPFNDSGRNFGNSVLKVRLSNTGVSSPSMVLADFFTPTDWTEYCRQDQDLGSGGVMLLPDQPQCPAHLLLARGKVKTIYLIDRDNMGRNTGQVVQAVPPDAPPNGFHGQPAYYQGPQGRFVFYANNAGPIQRYELVNGHLKPPAPNSNGISVDNFSGAPILTTSSNGTTPGTGIVWGVPPLRPVLQLYAYGADDLRQHLFAPLDAGPWCDFPSVCKMCPPPPPPPTPPPPPPPGCCPGSQAPPDQGPSAACCNGCGCTCLTSNPFVVPTVIHGKVYVGTTRELRVFGLPSPPRLTVNKKVMPSNDAGRFNLQIDGVTRAANVTNGGSTGPQTLAVGTHTVGETAGAGTNLSKYKTTFGGDCDSNGRVTLSFGDNQVCTLVNNAGACPIGQHCCTTPTSSSKCIPGCIPNTTACQPLCPPGKNKCCGAPLATGDCDTVCVNSSTEQCP
jgi:hypothetical protein